MRDASDKTIEHEILEIGLQVFGSKPSDLEDKIIRSFAKSRIIDGQGKDFPEWFDDVVDGKKEIGIEFLKEWPRQNEVRFHNLMRFLECDLVRVYAKDQVVEIRCAYFKASPLQISRCVPFNLQFRHCCWIGGLYIKGLKAKELQFEDCRGDLNITQAAIEGTFSISGGRIKRVVLEHIDCRHLVLTNCGSREIQADTLNVKQNIGISADTSHFMRCCLLTRFKAEVCNIGEILADQIEVGSAKISKSLKIAAKLNEEEDSDDAIGGLLNLTNTSVGDELDLTGIVAAHNSMIDLTKVTTNILNDGANTWPENGVIRLGGLQYQEMRRRKLLHRGSDIVKPTVVFPDRMKLLDRQKDWNVQSYHQLANSYVTQGHGRLAARTMAEGFEKLRKQTNRGPFSAIWTRIISATTGHGYQPELSLRWLGLFFVIGAVIFSLADMKNLMETTTNGPPPTTFNPIMYSLDALIPIIDFKQEKFWVPNGKGTYGMGVQIYSWIHTMMGWALVTLAITAFSGLIRKVE